MNHKDLVSLMQGVSGMRITQAADMSGYRRQNRTQRRGAACNSLVVSGSEWIAPFRNLPSIGPVRAKSTLDPCKSRQTLAVLGSLSRSLAETPHPSLHQSSLQTNDMSSL